MRLFIAVELPKEIKDELYKFQLKLKPFVKAVFVHKKNLHLTLKFLGDVKEDEVEEIKENLEKIKIKKFKASLNGTGIFPNEKFIKIIWISLKPENKVMELQKKVDEEMLGFFDKESRFSSHLTLARVKNVKDKKELLATLKSSELKGEFEIKEFSLIKSELSKDGPRYEIVETYSLE